MVMMKHQVKSETLSVLKHTGAFTRWQVLCLALGGGRRVKTTHRALQAAERALDGSIRWAGRRPGLSASPGLCPSPQCCENQPELISTLRCAPSRYKIRAL